MRDRLWCGVALLAVLMLAACGGSDSPSTGRPNEAAFGRMTADTTTSADTGAVAGTVQDDAGRPLAAAAVTVTTTSRVVDGPAFTCVTDDDGGFAIGAMAPGPYQLVVLHEGIGQLTERVRVQAGQITRPGVLRLQQRHGQGVGQGQFGDDGFRPIGDAGAVVGQVQDADGEPIARARVVLGGRMHAVTGPGGTFAFGPVRPGTYTVVAGKAGYQRAEQEAVVEAGDAARLLFVLQPGDDTLPPDVDPATVGGVVTDAETGAPVVGARVVLRGHGETTSADDGGYRFADVRPGGYILAVVADGYAPWHEGLRVPSGATLTVPVALLPTASTGRPTGDLRVTVVDEDDPSTVIVGAKVHINGRGPFFTGDDGTVLIEDVPAGERRLMAIAPGYEPEREDATVVAGQLNTVTLALERHERRGGQGGGHGGGQGGHG